MNNKIALINSKLEDFLSLVLYGYIVAVIFAEVAMRYLLGESLIWAEETARYVFIWLTYISMAAVARERGHLAFTMIRDALPRLGQLLILLFSDVLLVVLSTVVVFYAWRSVAMNIEFEQLMTSASLPLWLATLSVPAGWLLVLLRTMQRAVVSVMHYRRGEALLPSTTPEPV